MSKQHLPTPWYVKETGNGPEIWWGTGDCHQVCVMRWTDGMHETSINEDAAFIVRAVNLHEDLLEALEYVGKHRGEVPTHIADVCAIALKKAKP